MVGEASWSDASVADRTLLYSNEPVLGDALVVGDLLSEAAQAGLRAALGEAGWSGSDGKPLGRVALAGLGSSVRRRQLRELVEAALASDWDDESAGRLGQRRLGNLVPSARMLVEGGPVLSDTCGPRLLGVLGRAGWAQWPVLLDQTVEDAWRTPSLGVKAMAELIGMCFERGLEALAVSRQPASGADDVAAVLSYERASQAQPVLEALLDLQSGHAPAPICDAAQRLLRDSAPWALKADVAVTRLLGAAGEERSRALYLAWTSWRDRRSLVEVADTFGVSAQRAGQIVHGADIRVRAALTAVPAPMRWLVATARRRLGPVASEQEAMAMVARLGVSGPEGEVVLWLAGPYRPVRYRPGWLALEPREILARSLAFLAADGGVRRLADAEAELGVVGEQAREWLRACGAAVVHDLAVGLSGSLPVVAERLVDAKGQAMTAVEIVALLTEGGRAVTAEAVGAALRDRRFVSEPDGAFRLRDWAGDRGMPLQARGLKRSAEVPDPQPLAAPMASADAQSSDLSERDGRLWLWVRIDADVLRGADAIVPGALVEGLGVLAPTRRTFSSRYGPIVLAHDGPQPVRGSVRAVALAAGAHDGDTLMLGFSASDVVVDVRHATGQAGMADSIAAQTNPRPNSASGGTP